MQMYFLQKCFKRHCQEGIEGCIGERQAYS